MMSELIEYKTKGIEPFDDHDVICYATRDNKIGVTIGSPYPDGGIMILIDYDRAKQLIANLNACLEDVRLNMLLRKHK